MNVAEKDPLQPPYILAGFEIPSPLVNAAGSINGTSEENIIREVKTLAATGIGAIKVGSITIPEQEGVGLWQYDENTEEMLNYMGLPNVGRERGVRLVKELASIAHETGKPLIVSVSPVASQEYGSSVRQAANLIYAFMETEADMIELNTSCPHLGAAGQQHPPVLGHDLEAMEELSDELYSAVGSNRPLGIKPPADLHQYHESWLGFKVPEYLKDLKKPWLPSFAKILRERKVFAYIEPSNTIPNQKNMREFIASLSGSSQRVKILGRQQLNNYELELGDCMDIVSTLGVDSGREMVYRKRLGATAVSIHTRLWRTQDWGKAVTDVLEEYTEETTATQT